MTLVHSFLPLVAAELAPPQQRYPFTVMPRYQAAMLNMQLAVLETSQTVDKQGRPRLP